MTGRARRTSAVAGVVAAVVLTVAACGGGSGGKSSSSSSGGSSNAAPSAGASVDLSAVKATVNKALQRPTSINITAKLNGAPVKGKTIDWLQCSVPACVALTAPLKAATNTVGWKLNV